jgi:predicted permease
MPTFFDDLRFGVRNLIARPSFALVAVLLLGVGIGANATVYAWIENFILKPLPGVAALDEVVALHGTTRTRRDISMSYPNFADLAARRPESVRHLAAFRQIAVNVRAGEAPERAWGEIVTGEYFALLGVTPHLGRVLGVEDDRVPDGHPVVVLSHRYWTRRFASNPSIVGSPVAVNGTSFTVVGVAADDFRGGFPAMATDLWMPMMMQRAVYPGNQLVARGNAWLSVLARLAPGATMDQARAGLSSVAAQLATEYPGINTDRGIAVYTLATDPQTAAGLFGPIFGVLAVVTGVVLLIVCANLASLLLVRGAARQREFAVRLALGASRTRLVRQLIVEHLVLAIAGAFAGVLFAIWASRAFGLLVPPTPQPVDASVAIGPGLVLVSLALALATTTIFGVLPALSLSRPALAPTLKESRGAIGGRARTRVRSTLVASQVALSTLLLAAAVLFGRTLVNAQQVDPGFDLTHGLIASLDLQSGGYDAARGVPFLEALVERVDAIPGVEAAAISRDLPLRFGSGSDTSADIEGYTPAEGEEITLGYDRISPDFFRVLGAPLVAGRTFTAQDTAQAPRVVIVNETMARRYWKDGNAVGRRMNIGEWVTVVGVVGDMTYGTPGSRTGPYFYMPISAYYRPDVTLTVRATSDAATLAEPVRAALRSLDPGLPLFDVRTMADRREMVVFLPRLAATLLAGLSGVAGLLAAIGLYGLLAFVVAQRRPEIGVRLALGARPIDVRRMVVRQGMRLAVAGVAMGLGLAFLAMPLAASQLVGVSARDAASYAGAATVLLLAAFAASHWPARRAASVDPVDALRGD